MSRCTLSADNRLNLLNEIICKLLPLAHLHKKHNTNIIFPFLPNHNTLQYRLNFVYLTINLSRTNANTTRIKDRIRTTINHNAAMLCDFCKITVGPDIFKMLIVGRMIFMISFIIPKEDRTRWE